MITQERLQELLHYNPGSGEFTRRVSRGNSKVGSVAGYIGEGYIVIGVDDEYYSAHRLAFLYMEGEFPPDQVDHINTVRSDNRWCNIRRCTAKENNNNPLTAAKRSAAQMGNTYGKGNVGMVFTDEHKAKLSAAHIGKAHTTKSK